jgi:hypothetical protein
VKFIEQATPERRFGSMLPPSQDFLQLVSIHRRQREAEAWAERFRQHGRLRARVALLLYALADRLAPAPSVSSADGEPAGRYS